MGVRAFAAMAVWLWLLATSKRLSDVAAAPSAIQCNGTGVIRAVAGNQQPPPAAVLLQTVTASQVAMAQLFYHSPTMAEVRRQGITPLLVCLDGNATKALLQANGMDCAVDNAALQPWELAIDWEYRRKAAVCLLSLGIDVLFMSFRMHFVESPLAALLSWHRVSIVSSPEHADWTAKHHATAAALSTEFTYVRANAATLQFFDNLEINLKNLYSFPIEALHVAGWRHFKAKHSTPTATSNLLAWLGASRGGYLGHFDGIRAAESTVRGAAVRLAMLNPWFTLTVPPHSTIVRSKFAASMYWQLFHTPKVELIALPPPRAAEEMLRRMYNIPAVQGIPHRAFVKELGVVWEDEIDWETKEPSPKDR